MSELTTANFVEVCLAEDLWIGEMQAFDVGKHKVIVINAEGQLHAYDGMCPHQSVQLIEGNFDDGVLMCRAHQWTFDACTGKGVNPSSHCLTRFPLRIDEGRVLVGDEPLESKE